MKFAAREALAVVPMGAGTWLDVGNPMRGGAIVVSTSRMTRILKHEPADLVASAEAGVTLTAFQNQIARSRQYLPIDPPDNRQATLGGVVATGLGGVQAYNLGRPRAFVIGMRVILSDGRAIKAGGNVVKNVAGYDLCKLFTGSYGTLGFITELIFKLRPLPAETRTITAFGSFDSLLLGARALLASHLFPQAIEILSPRFAAHLEAGNRHTLLIKFAGSSQSVIHQTAQALAALRKAGNITCSTFAGNEEALWQALGATPLRVPEHLISRVSVLPTRLSEFLTELLQLDEASHPQLMWHAGIADGRVRVIARSPVYYREAVRALERLRAKAEALGGSLILENAPAEIKTEFDSWGGAGTSLALMKRVKQQLDPNGMFSPGRFVGGI
jgi:FAD/FMN-containing dehydrogenase